LWLDLPKAGSRKGFDFPSVVRGAIKKDALEKTPANAAAARGTEVAPDMATKVADLIREQGSGSKAATS
jgi:hypothetical protein